GLSDTVSDLRTGGGLGRVRGLNRLRAEACDQGANVVALPVDDAADPDQNRQQHCKSNNPTVRSWRTAGIDVVIVISCRRRTRRHKIVLVKRLVCQRWLRDTRRFRNAWGLEATRLGLSGH